MIFRLLKAMHIACIYPNQMASGQMKKERGQRSGIYNIMYHTWPRIPHGKVTNTQLDITYESQEVSPFPAGDHKA